MYNQTGDKRGYTQIYSTVSVCATCTFTGDAWRINTWNRLSNVALFLWDTSDGFRITITFKSKHHRLVGLKTVMHEIDIHQNNEWWILLSDPTQQNCVHVAIKYTHRSLLVSFGCSLAYVVLPIFFNFIHLHYSNTNIPTPVESSATTTLLT